MEERYWQVVEARDREAYIALWDDAFVGWPDNCPAPIGKDAIRSDTFATLRDLKDFHLERKAVQVNQDVALTFYVVTATHTPRDRPRAEITFRITHTWRKVNGVWLIIGGMSGNYLREVSRTVQN